MPKKNKKNILLQIFLQNVANNIYIFLHNVICNINIFLKQIKYLKSICKKRSLERDVHYYFFLFSCL